MSKQYLDQLYSNIADKCIKTSKKSNSIIDHLDGINVYFKVDYSEYYLHIKIGSFEFGYPNFYHTLYIKSLGHNQSYQTENKKSQNCLFKIMRYLYFVDKDSAPDQS